MEEVSEGQQKLVSQVPNALTGLTAVLGLAGGLTGAIARMFRNHEAQSVLAVVLAVLAVALGYLANLPKRSWAVTTMLVTASLAFGASLVIGGQAMIDTVSEQDRPTLNAKLTESSGRWHLEGAASASGLKAKDALQVSVFAYNRSDPSWPAKKLFFVTAGPNADGIASQAFNVPLPPQGRYTSFAVSASLGAQPRTCNGTALKRDPNPNKVQSQSASPAEEAATPTTEPSPAQPGTGSPSAAPAEPTTACVVLAASPVPTETTASAGVSQSAAATSER